MKIIGEGWHCHAEDFAVMPASSIKVLVPDLATLLTIQAACECTRESSEWWLKSFNACHHCEKLGQVPDS